MDYSAVFTGLLVLVGSLQFWAFMRQLSLMSASIQEAKKASEVAERTVEAASESNRILQHQFVEERRPWISASAELSSPLLWEERGLRFDALLRFKNIGQIPATHVFVEAVASVLGPVTKDTLALLNAHMADVKHRRSLPNADGRILFPGEELVVNFGLLVSNEDIELNAHPMRIEEQENSTTVTTFLPFMVGNVAYRFSGSEEIHQTGFSYRLVRLLQGEKLPRVLFKEDGDVPLAQAGLVPNYDGIAT